MMLLFDFVLLIAGFVALIKGADLFVDGSAGLAKAFRVPGLIIGLTIVALGTSAPELAVSTVAAVQGSNELALSNVIGSNTFNLLCVLGVCALLHPVPVDSVVLRRDFPVSVAATVFILVGCGGAALFTGALFAGDMAQNVGTVTRLAAATVLLAFLVYVVYLILDARRHPEPEEAAAERMPLWKCALLIVIGIALIVGGGQAVVYAAKAIARAAGMTETLIGLTIVAIGTSLPELVTSIVAAKKGETSLAVGNAVGSNLFNLMFILGISALIRPIAVNLASVLDLVILLLASILTLVFARSGRKITRPEGAVMLAVYAADVVFAVLR